MNETTSHAQKIKDIENQELGHTDFIKAKLLGLVVGGGGGSFLGKYAGKALGKWEVALKIGGGFLGAVLGSFMNWQKEKTSQTSLEEVIKQRDDLQDLRTEYFQSSKDLYKTASEQPHMKISGAQHSGHINRKESELAV